MTTTPPRTAATPPTTTDVSSSSSSSSSSSPIEFDARERRLLRALDPLGTGVLTRRGLLEALAQVGLRETDLRLAELMALLAPHGLDDQLSAEEIVVVMRPNRTLIQRALLSELVIPDFAALCTDINEISARAQQVTGGTVADYIPQLARVNPELFAVSVCSIDGQRFSIGDVREGFSVQSCSKPISYCAALEEHGEDVVHAVVGREPSGRGFNELTLNKDHKPHNPMINSGAIATLSLVQAQAPTGDRFDAIMDFWTQLAGGERPGFSNSVYLSERQSADRNFALGYFMREKKVFRDDVNLLETLEFYFQCCSIESNAEQMAVIAGTLANGGVCPTTGVRVLQPSTVRACLSLMSSCGMYEFSGEFAFSIGLPAKSGVSGALMIVIPNVMGLCVYSPPLDSVGNSVRGIEFSRALVERFNFHNYDNFVSALEYKKDPRHRVGQRRVDTVTALCQAASQGDLQSIEHLVARGADLDAGDYDGRTPLHLAAAEGQLVIVEALLARGVATAPRDRFGYTPLDEARRGGHRQIVTVLEATSAAPSLAG